MTTRRSVIAGVDCLIAEPHAANDDTETIVCLHGIGGDDASFAPQSVGLASEYRVVVWNMPGYRQSQRLENLSFAALADSLCKMINELKLDAVHLMGQSIGGMVAQEMFHRYPEKINSLILVATTAAFGGRDDSFKDAFLEARLKPLDHGKTMQQVAEDSIPAIVGKTTEPHLIRSAIDSMATLDEAVYRQVLSCLVTFNRRKEWQNISCPLCLVAGSEDTNAPVTTMQKMADKLPQAEFHQIPGAGHLLNLERGEAFNEIVLSFLSRSRQST